MKFLEFSSSNLHLELINSLLCLCLIFMLLFLIILFYFILNIKLNTINYNHLNNLITPKTNQYNKKIEFKFFFLKQNKKNKKKQTNLRRGAKPDTWGTGYRRSGLPGAKGSGLGAACNRRGSRCFFVGARAGPFHGQGGLSQGLRLGVSELSSRLGVRPRGLGCRGRSWDPALDSLLTRPWIGAGYVLGSDL
jgi:hypothetical protein